MKLWSPFHKREDSSYTNTLIALIQERVNNGPTPTSAATGALEAASGMVQRAFMAAEVDAPDAIKRVLTPGCLGMIGRALIRSGQIVFVIRTSEGALELLPAETHDVRGEYAPTSWEYRITVGGPSNTATFENVPAESALHFRYAVDPEYPWRGLSPLGVASLAGKLSAETSAALGNEASMPVGSFLPLPVDGDDSTIAKLKADVRASKGGILAVESGDWGNAGGGTGADYMARRFGAAPPDGLVKLLDVSSREVFSACGISPALFGDAQGTAQREAYRQFLFGLVAPLGRMVSQELSDKLEADVSLDWTELRAADIAGRARAFQSLVGAGMETDRAAALSGLLMND